MKKWMNKKNDKRKDKKEAKKLEKKMQKRIDEEVAGGNKFAELTFGYIWKYYDTNRYGMRYGKEKTKFIEMSKPRPCSYNKTDGYTNTIGSVKVTKTIPIEAPPSHSTSSTLPVEYCGITMRQVHAVLANMERRCVAEGWKDRDGSLLTPDKVNLYHLDEYIIKPFTIKTKHLL